MNLVTMKNIKHILFLWVVVLTGLSLTGCNSEDNLDTDQYGNGISVTSFGPCPVLRGGTLHFLGANLDQIAEIDLPGADPITQYEVVKAGRESEITIQVPAEKCDTGIVVLKTQKGGEIRTLTPITYREDIVVKDFFVGDDTQSKVGNVGDILTIQGDYLNLLHGVIFADNDTVPEDQFVSHDRYTIKVAIPDKAKSGFLTLTNLAQTPTEIRTAEALTVNLPENGTISNAHPKAGQALTITGSSYDQIAAVNFQGATVTDFEVAADGKSLTVFVPATAKDGEVFLRTKSGVLIPAGSITTVVPTDLSSSAAVKNGADVTINGKDLDLVTTVTFPNVKESVDPKSVTASKLVVTVPETAQEGDLTLTLANGKTVSVAYTLVKPVVKSFTPATVTAGSEVLLRGTDLDLVASVSFPGETPLTASAEATKITATSIVTTIPTAAYGKGCTLNLKNGTTIQAEGLTIIAATEPALTGEAKGVVGEYTTITGKNFNNVEAVYIGTTKVVKYREKNNTSMTFQVPSTLTAGDYDLVLVTPDGEKVNVGTFHVESAEVVLWEGEITETGWTNQPYVLSDGGAELKAAGAKAGQKLYFYMSGDPGWQCKIQEGHWGAEYALFKEADRNAEGACVLTITQEMLNAAYTQQGWGGTFLLNGDGNVKLTKITLK